MSDSSIDLNIIDRGLDGQQWTSERGKITKDDLYKIHEQKTGNGGALNALPTPFARFFIFREAFRRVQEERVNPRNEAGRAYRRLVSDCLDVYELLFNLKYHRNHWPAQRDLVIKEWVYADCMPELKQRMPVLYNALKSYYDTDIKQKCLYFIVLKENGKEKLLATSSPITGFITPPDLDRVDTRTTGNITESRHLGQRYEGMKLARRPMDGKRARGCYFGEVELFEDRPADFKNYMYQMFSADCDETMAEIKRYVTSFGDTDSDIRSDFDADWEPVQSENSETLSFSGITICSSNAIDVNKFFTDSIIRIPYRMSTCNFYTPLFVGREDRDYDYLLPLTEYAMTQMPVDSMDCCIKEKLNGRKVCVELSYKGKTYAKEYDNSGISEENKGQIIDLADPFKVNLELGLFPNIQSEVPAENNYYKLMLVITDSNDQRTFDIEETTCTFFAPDGDARGNVMIEEADGNFYQNGMKHPVVRSVQDDVTRCSSKFYEVFNTELTAISLHLKMEGRTHSGVLIPKLHKQTNPTREYTYAIDFGTSNTYISKRLKGSNLEPEQLVMSDTMMSYLHEVRKSRQQAPIDLWEDIPFDASADFFHTEFVPPFIDGHRYRFPLRTAMVRTKREQHTPALFDNHNIAFSYEKRKLVGDQEVCTDIKWSDDVTEARLFIRELLMIVKCDALLSDARLARTDIVWFYPLSLSRMLKERYDEIWKVETNAILGIPSNQVRSYTESEAPYYYYSEKDVFDSIDSVVVMDIGGGSTDMVYFSEGKPQIANSVHFGCDVLWGNGYNKMSNARDNGVVNRYKDLLSFDDNEELSELNQQMLSLGSVVSTRDIIDFWLSNDSKTRVGHERFSSCLRRECKPLFLYHYAALVFYMAHLLKTQELPCPNAITFSGNGSRYVDQFISLDTEVLTDLTMVVLKSVFGEGTKRVQLILRDCRKESTCYGGLFRDASKPSPRTVLFNGIDGTQYEKVSDITADYQQGVLRQGIIDRKDELNRLYMEMLRVLVSKEELDNVRTDAIAHELEKGNAEALDKNFKEEVRDRLDPNASYRDSLFFIPVIDKVTDLTHIEKYIK